MSGSGEEFIIGEVKNYDERTKQTTLGTLYIIKYDVEVSSPDDLVGDIHVLMEGYDKTGALENGSVVQFDKSKSEFEGRKFKTNAVQNTDTLQLFKVTPKDIVKIPWRMIIIGIVAAAVVIGVAVALSINPSEPTANFQVISSCNIVIKGTWIIDFETCTLINNGDLWWRQVDSNTRYLVPSGGAQVVNLGIVDINSITDPTKYSYSNNKIDGSVSSNTIPPGTVVLIKTGEGNYAKMLIDSYGYNLTVKIQLMKQV